MIRCLLLAAALAMHALASASVVTAQYTPLGGSAWTASFTVQNDGTLPSIGGFTIFFPETEFAALAVEGYPSTWDTIVAQPDLGLPAAGFMDSFAIAPADALGSGQSVGGFQIAFSFLGTGAPGRLAYDIVDADFAVLETGFTAIVPASVVPEPGTALLVALALVLAGLLRISGRPVVTRDRDCLPTLIGHGVLPLRRPFEGLVQNERARLVRGRQTSEFSAFRWTGRMQVHWASSPGRFLRLLLVSVLMGQAAMVLAAPAVDGIILMESSRVDRTRFDYTYRLVVRGDALSYSGASMAVTSTSPSTVVTKSVVTLGELDAGATVRSTDSFIIRHDRTVPFDPASLKFTFSGSERAIDTVSGIRIGTVEFRAEAGRAGHESLLPIQQSSPTSGDSLNLSAAIDGEPTSVAYAFESASGATLTTGFLIRPAGSLLSRFNAQTIIPAQPFQIRLTAMSSGGAATTWKSARTYTPSAVRLVLEPQTGLMTKGSTVPATITISSVTVSGWRKVWLVLPTGFSSSSGGWDVLLTPGQQVVLQTNISAPSSGPSFRPFVLGVAMGATNALANALFSDVTVLVE